MKARIEASQVVMPAVWIVTLGILTLFAHSGLSGEHGLSALRQAEALEQELAVELDQLRDERAEIANRVARLDERYLDLDLLDERIRAVLGHGRPDEILIR